MDETTRDPEAVLARLRTEEPAALAQGGAARGRLKLFFGFAAGVGKTYTMLEAARTAAQHGEDIVLGYVEPHGRPETEALTLGMELLPTRAVRYRDVELREFDLDAALKRKPRIVCVDELAHTNAPGSRHAKRWQDVEELLDAGIDVWTTLNVQHIESLNDVIAQITGIVVRETLPDAVFDRADEVELVDLPPDELLERLRDGKVYVPVQAARAVERFFRMANLIALREIAMRRTADRIGTQVQTARLGQTRTQTWPTRERLLVCVGPSPTSAKVIRTAKRMAAAMHAEWMAAHTETPRDLGLSDADRQRLVGHMRLAEQLGAETVTLAGEDVVAEVIACAQARNVTKIVIGKTDRPRWSRFRKPSLVDRLINNSGDIDIYVIRGVEEKSAPAPGTAAVRSGNFRPYLMAAAVMALATAVAWLFDALGMSDTNLVMVYLLGVVFVAARLGFKPAFLASVLAVALFNFLFTEPYYTFAVRDAQYLVVFAVMQVIAVLVSVLTARIRGQVALARQRERRTASLFQLSRRLTGSAGRHQLVAIAQEQLHDIVGCDTVIFLPDDRGRVGPALRRGHGVAERPSEAAVAQWVFDQRKPAGRSTDTLPDAAGHYLPLAGADGAVGVLALYQEGGPALLSPEQRQLLDALASQVALALERDRLAEEAQRMLAQAEAERLRSSLLSTVSHDLRTPLAAIAGASSTLLQSRTTDVETRRELLTTIYDEADRLSRLVENLLHMTRIESGSLKVARQWQPIEEVIGTALNRLERQLDGREVRTVVPPDLPMASIDGLLIEQALINLIDNAVKYSPAGSPIEISAAQVGAAIEISVADRGRGLQPGEEQRVFEKFYRGQSVTSTELGAGLGLAICEAIARAHAGAIRAENRPGGGAVLTLSLPIVGSPPAVPVTADDNPERQPQPRT
jgi:two-component system, OmpR family, sensor histidine kinase KdpD